MMTAEEAARAAERVMARCDELACISETPGLLTRVYLSPEHLRANALVATWMQQAGMRTAGCGRQYLWALRSRLGRCSGGAAGVAS